MTYKYPRGQNRKLTMQLKGRTAEMPEDLGEDTVAINGKYYRVERFWRRCAKGSKNAWTECTLVPVDMPENESEALIYRDKAIRAVDIVLRMDGVSDALRTKVAARIKAIGHFDAAPVMYGHWVADPDGGEICLECSLCGEQMWVGEYQEFPKYCPECGAKMEEDDKC